MADVKSLPVHGFSVVLYILFLVSLGLYDSQPFWEQSIAQPEARRRGGCCILPLSLMNRFNKTESAVFNL